MSWNPVEEFKDFVEEDIAPIGQTYVDALTGKIYEEQISDVKDFLDDPLGIKEAGDESRALAEASAQAGIESMEEQNAMLEELYKPYADQARQTLPQLQAMIMGGDVDYKPSKLYEYQKEIGTRNIKRTQASRGHFGSTGTESKLASFYGDLAGEEAERAYGGAMSQIQLGSGASDAIASAGSSTAGNVGSLYSNLSRQQSNISSSVNASRQSLYAGLQNSLQGMSQYMVQQGG